MVVHAVFGRSRAPTLPTDLVAYLDDLLRLLSTGKNYCQDLQPGEHGNLLIKKVLTFWSNTKI